MPIYEYACQICEYEFEAIQSFRDDPLTECPACNTIGLRKKLTAAAFHLKGTGWYETDFKGKDQKQEKKSESGNEEKAPSNGDSNEAKVETTNTTAKAEKASNTASAS